MTLVLALAAAPLPAAGPIDFPTALKTRWTYHLHQEMGEGVHFGEADAKLAKGNVLDTSVVATITGVEVIGGVKYARVESLREGSRPWLTEWYASGPAGLLLAKIVDAEGGSENAMNPPQKLLLPTLQPGASWTWKDTKNPISMSIRIVGAGPMQVPAGNFQAIETAHDTALGTQGLIIHVKQKRWYTARVGYIKQDSETRAGTRLFSHVILTLEKFEPAQ